MPLNSWTPTAIMHGRQIKALQLLSKIDLLTTAIMEYVRMEGEQRPDLVIFPGRSMVIRCSKHAKHTNLLKCSACKYVDARHHTMHISRRSEGGTVIPTKTTSVCLITAFLNLPTWRTWLLQHATRAISSSPYAKTIESKMLEAGDLYEAAWSFLKQLFLDTANRSLHHAADIYCLHNGVPWRKQSFNMAMAL